MTIISIIIVLIVASINISNYSVSNKRARQTLDLISANHGEIPREEPIDFSVSDFKNRERGFGDERFFTVEKTGDSTYICKLDFINTIDDHTAVSYFESAIKSKKEYGKIGDFRYLVSNNYATFLDCKHDFDSQRRFLVFSIALTCSGLGLFFILLYFGSKLVFKNVFENEEKQEEFITDASHELKTPLMIISANNELIELKNGKSEESDTISKEIQNLNKMVSSLLTVSKSRESISKGKEIISLSELANETVAAFQPIATRNHISLTANIQDNIMVKTNSVACCEVLKIILENAIKYAKTEVSFSITRTKKTVELIQSNDSDFKEDKDLNYLTARFFRDDANSSKNVGSGIGLSMLKSLLDNRRHSLNIYSKNGRFYLQIKSKF